MPSVSNSFVVDRPIGDVFDFVTTARHWPRWHPATRAVEGLVDGPPALGDTIVEHVTIAGIAGSGVWTVTERERPTRMVLEAELSFGRLRISYELSTVDGGSTRFQRDLEFPDLGPQIGAAMAQQSAQGIANLAALVGQELSGLQGVPNK